MLDYFNKEIKPLADSLYPEDAEPWELNWLTGELDRILERYENDDGVTRQNYQGMLAVAADITFALEQRLGSNTKSHKIYLDKMIDNKVKPMSPGQLKESLQSRPF